MSCGISVRKSKKTMKYKEVFSNHAVDDAVTHCSAPATKVIEHLVVPILRPTTNHSSFCKESAIKDSYKCSVGEIFAF